MKFVSVRDFRINPGKIWEWLKDGEELVLTSHGKPFALIVDTDERRLEAHLRELRRLQARIAVSAIRRRSAELDLQNLTQKEVEEIIAETRHRRIK